MLFCFSSLLFSCGESYYFQKDITLELKEWGHDDMLAYEFSISDSIQPYDLYLDVVSSKDYSYENVYIKLETSFPTDTVISDRLSLELNNKDGSYTGDCSGHSCTTRFVLQKNARFKHLGDYSLLVHQDTREALLVGIESVGFYVQESVLEEK